MVVKPKRILTRIRISHEHVFHVMLIHKTRNIIYYHDIIMILSYIYYIYINLYKHLSHTFIVLFVHMMYHYVSSYLSSVENALKR